MTEIAEQIQQTIRERQRRRLALLNNRIRAEVATWDDHIEAARLQREVVDQEFAEGKPARERFVKLGPRYP